MFLFSPGKRCREEKNQMLTAEAAGWLKSVAPLFYRMLTVVIGGPAIFLFSQVLTEAWQCLHSINCGHLLLSCVLLYSHPPNESEHHNTIYISRHWPTKNYVY